MDKRITKEWNKIKDYNIFNDINEFALLFLEKPYGVCLRKYTSYPWCKENFFFGSYDELKQWYKETDEIPFYVKESIGQKFGGLTVLEFLYKNKKNGVRSLHAKCKCDCGNVVDVDFWALKHGDIVRCGCKRAKKITSLYDRFKDIVEERWDYSKNEEDPKSIEFDSDHKYWWKGYKENYLMAPQELLSKPKGTSFPEQAIFFYLNKMIPHVESRAKIQCGDKKVEADIFLRDYNIAIEYDGVAWHSNKPQRDIEKNILFAGQNIYVIRARESGLNDIDIPFGQIIEVDIENLSYLEAIAQAINEIIEAILRKVHIADLSPIKELSTLIRGDKIAIENQYLQAYEQDSIANTWLSVFWDEENGIEPYKVSVQSSDKFYFRCHANHSILISPNAIIKIFDKIDTEENKEQMRNTLLIGSDCPFASLQCCPCNALYHLKDLEPPCPAFIHFSRTTPLIKRTTPFDDDIEADMDLRIIPFNKYSDNYLSFIKTIKEYDEHTKLALIRYFTNILFYKVSEVQDTLTALVALPIASVVKQKYLETVFCYPHFWLSDVCKVFMNEDLLKFYFAHFDYKSMFVNEGGVILNLLHTYSIFDTIKCFIYDKKLAILDEALHFIKNQINDNEMNIILLSLALQLSDTKNYRFKELKTEIKTYNRFLAILSKYATQDSQEEIFTLLGSANLIVKAKYYQIFIATKMRKSLLQQQEISEIYKTLSGTYDLFFQVINGAIELLQENPEKCKELRTMIEHDCYISTTADGKIFWYASKSNLQQDHIFDMTYGYADFPYEQKQNIIAFLDDFLKKNPTISVDISNIDEPTKYIEWFNEYGIGRFKFNLNVIINDEICSKQFFNIILKCYDGESGYSRKHISIAYIYEQCKKIYLLGSMPDVFLQRLKKLILYIEYHRTDLSTYRISNGYDINTLLGVERENSNQCIVRIHDIDDPITYKEC